MILIGPVLLLYFQTWQNPPCSGGGEHTQRYTFIHMHIQQPLAIHTRAVSRYYSGILQAQCQVEK